MSRSCGRANFIKFAVAAMVLPLSAMAQMLPWHMVSTPTQHKPQIYGSYTAGCMDGGIKLPAKGKGFVHRDISQGRSYAQPELITYINNISNKIYHDYNRTIIIADLASPRGGPAPINSSLHTSHQIGLDADIWFRSAKSAENANKIKQVSMIDGNKINTKYWNKSEVEILKIAASDVHVDRIFVNRLIKKELCKKHNGQPWLSKIRPWWGHASHFHVRLKCPENDDNCQAQKPPVITDDCGTDLAWWFSDESKPENLHKEPRKYPVLPKECAGVFAGE